MESKMGQYLQEMLELYHREDFTAVTGCSDNRSKDSSFIHLQRQLALKTYYLREYALIPVMNHLLNSRVKCELVRLYRAYCYFFDLELSAREFSAFLAHVIIDGFLRACIFYSGVHSNNETPFPRTRVVDFAKFTVMPERRLALFKYLSSEGDQLPTPVKWMLDDISGLLWSFDFKQMGFSSKNSLVIDGERLQWEGYFFKPYYENEEEYKRIRELLQKEGIFSSVINGEKHKK
jgi:hypothetical protein